MSISLTVTRWRDDRLEFLAKHPDGTARNLAGCNIFFAVSLTEDGEFQLIAAALGAGIVVTNAAAGAFAVLLPPLAKIGLSSLTTYYWDILLVDTAGALVAPEGIYDGGAQAELSGTMTVRDGIATAGIMGVAVPLPQMATHAELTRLTGGTATDLDGFNATVLNLPFVFIVYIGGLRQEWMARALVDGDAASSLETPDAEKTFVAPATADLGAGEIIWERKF